MEKWYLVAIGNWIRRKRAATLSSRERIPLPWQPESLRIRAPCHRDLKSSGPSLLRYIWDFVLFFDWKICFTSQKYWECFDLTLHAFFVKNDNIFVISRSNPANTKHLYQIYSTSAQRRRRWSNIDECDTEVLCLLGNLTNRTIWIWLSHLDRVSSSLCTRDPSLDRTEVAYWKTHRS